MGWVKELFTGTHEAASLYGLIDIAKSHDTPIDIRLAESHKDSTLKVA